MSKPVVDFEVLECDSNGAVVMASGGATFRIRHATDIEIAPREAAPVWSHKSECAVIGTDGFDIEVDTIVNHNAELFLSFDKPGCKDDDGDVVLKVYLTKQMVKDIHVVLVAHIEAAELKKLENAKED